MRHGFFKAAAVTPDVRVADPHYNTQRIIEAIDEAQAAGAGLIVFPELCLTGYTCQDLFLQETLLAGARQALREVTAHTAGTQALVFVGLPLSVGGKLYNAAAAIQNGRLLGLVPKRFLPTYAEFYEGRHFAPGPEWAREIVIDGESVPFGTKLLFSVDAIEGLCVACELCEDVWVPDAPDIAHAMAGAVVLVNLSGSNETIGKDDYRRALLTGVSARTISGYVYASCGVGESTQDLVFGGHDLILENGTILAQSRRFENGIVYAEIDVQRLLTERRRMSTFRALDPQEAGYREIPVHMERRETALTRRFDPRPFVPSDRRLRERRCEEILNIQAHGLAKRYAHTGLRSAVLGISGGLDSTLALLVTARAFDILGIGRENILAVTMPCFGTTGRTYRNACDLTRALGATLREVDIRESVTRHFADIGHDPAVHDVTYENGQARERTQVLMDLANQTNGLVIGTGDMSELALGWATYNGDHMSMYGVNVGVPKTLVRHLVSYAADRAKEQELAAVLRDILDTPVSPELLPPTQDGMISQKTEDLVGPYELHDFFLYYMVRCGFSPDKIYRLACAAFEGMYDAETIRRWEKTFCRRFFSQQFKRSCLPDGPKVGSVALSPRGDWRMPSDADAVLWLEAADASGNGQ
ncbi:MAG: NAD(+) synthase [Eubacteriales bacterium]|nr:NAD(+) synthase [Eubacteriales bacterium]